MAWKSGKCLLYGQRTCIVFFQVSTSHEDKDFTLSWRSLNSKRQNMRATRQSFPLSRFNYSAFHWRPSFHKVTLIWWKFACYYHAVIWLTPIIRHRLKVRIFQFAVFFDAFSRCWWDTKSSKKQHNSCDFSISTFPRLLPQTSALIDNPKLGHVIALFLLQIFALVLQTVPPWRHFPIIVFAHQPSPSFNWVCVFWTSTYK